jgi:uncharacterized protein (DUF952 family)
MTSPVAYKVLTDAEMKELETGAFTGSAVDLKDGYIHLSTADQLTETVNKHFTGQSDLWVAAVDLTAQDDLVKWEESRGGALFPHLYGPLLLETAIAYEPLARDENNRVRLPVAG